MPFLAPIIPAISAISAGVGAASAVGGGIVSGLAQQKSADYNAQIQENNAMTANRNAQLASEMGEQAAQQKGMQTSQQVGKAKALAGASGIDPDTGSASSVQSGITSAGLTDVQTIQSNAARQAWGYETQASNSTAQASLDKMQGQTSMDASFLSGASTGLNSWLKLGNVGSSNLASNTV